MLKKETSIAMVSIANDWRAYYYLMSMKKRKSDQVRYQSESEVEVLGSVVGEGLSAHEQAKELPHSPGVYLMKDAKDTIIYIGKAKDLRKRVANYFLSNRSAKTDALVRKIVRIEHIITGNEYEALVLENNLIKKYSPHYNISLKDGKSYPMIRITNEPFPKVFKTRRMIDDGSLYYGPYPDAGKLDLYLDLINRLFPLRRCSTPLRRRDRPCLYYHIGLCSGPCAGLVSEEEYNKSIQAVKNLLEGRSEGLIARLEGEMAEASRNLNFEEAATKRDQIAAIRSVAVERQVQDFTQESRDYAAIEMRGPLCTISLMQMREGQLIGRALYRAETLADETETLLNFLVQYYADGLKRPSFSTSPMRSTSPSSGGTSPNNWGTARCRAARWQALSNFTHGPGERITRCGEAAEGPGQYPGPGLLAEVVGLSEPPALIEGFDVSHLERQYTVASLISFRDGGPTSPTTAVTTSRAGWEDRRL